MPGEFAVVPSAATFDSTAVTCHQLLVNLALRASRQRASKQWKRTSLNEAGRWRRRFWPVGHRGCWRSCGAACAACPPCDACAACAACTACTAWPPCNGPPPCNWPLPCNCPPCNCCEEAEGEVEEFSVAMKSVVEVVAQLAAETNSIVYFSGSQPVMMR